MFWTDLYYTIHMSDLSGDNLETLVNTDDVPGMLCVHIFALRYKCHVKL